MLGYMAGDTGDQEEAVRRYRAVLALDSSNLLALNNIAYALEASQPDEALKYAQQAVELAPDNAMALDTLGWVYYKRAIYDTAVTYLEKSVAKEPIPRRQFHLAMCYLKQGQHDLGEKNLQLALRQDPKLPVEENRW
jgi:tetratricopeptide (TPR) repeat protein